MTPCRNNSQFKIHNSQFKILSPKGHDYLQSKSSQFTINENRYHHSLSGTVGIAS